MSKRLAGQIREHMECRTTDDLLGIWTSNDREAFSDDVFEVIRQILRDRGVEVPSQESRPSRETPRQAADAREDVLARRGPAGRAVYGVFRVQAFGLLMAAICLLGLWGLFLASKWTSASSKDKSVDSVSTIAWVLGASIGLYILWKIVLSGAKSCRYGGEFWKTLALMNILFCFVTFMPPVLVHKFGGDGWYLDVFLAGRLWTLPWPAGLVHLLGLLLFASTFVLSMVSGRSLKAQPIKGNVASNSVWIGLALIGLCGCLEVASRYIAWCLR